MLRLYSNVFVLLIIVAGIICLQVFLSRKQNKILGLILPAISFMYSLLMLFSIVASFEMSTAEILGMHVGVFLMGNIPTAILVIIYFACREKTKAKKELEKMNIQDLE